MISLDDGPDGWLSNEFGLPPAWSPMQDNAEPSSAQEVDAFHQGEIVF